MLMPDDAYNTILQTSDNLIKWKTTLMIQAISDLPNLYLFFVGDLFFCNAFMIYVF